MQTDNTTEVLLPESRDAIALTIPNAEALPPSMLTNIREGFQDAFNQADIEAKRESFAKWIEAQISNL